MKKYRVVIIDDKPLIREALIHTIPWNDLKCKVVAEAADGIQAKKMIIKEKPEIIISDIRMPGMDGLELAEFVKEYLPHSKTIIITGYQEFEYAKKALQLGVYDFLMKPLDNQNVEEVLRKAITKIEETRDSLKILQNRTIYEAVMGTADLSALPEKELEQLGVRNRYYLVVVCRIKTSNVDIISQITKMAIFSMEDYAKKNDVKLMDITINQDVVFYVFLKKEKSSRTHHIRIKNHLLHFNNMVKKEYQWGCCFAVSQISTQLSKVTESFQQALSVLNSGYFTSEEEVLFSNSYPLIQELDSGHIIEDLDQFYNAIEHLPKEELEEEITNIIDKISANAKGNEFQIKCLLSEICITIYRHFYKYFAEDSNVNQMIQEINHLADIKEVKQYLCKYLELIRNLLEKKQEGKNPLVDSAIAFIRQNYQKEISLTMVADYLTTNSSYLSRLLKQEMGKNFTDILTEIRIAKAKQLLNEPGSRIIEVGERVGYSDYTYFYQVFKKMENISPSEYKKLGKSLKEKHFQPLI